MHTPRRGWDAEPVGDEGGRTGRSIPAPHPGQGLLERPHTSTCCWRVLSRQRCRQPCRQNHAAWHLTLCN